MKRTLDALGSLQDCQKNQKQSQSRQEKENGPLLEDWKPDGRIGIIPLFSYACGLRFYRSRACRYI